MTEELDTGLRALELWSLDGSAVDSMQITSAFDGGNIRVLDSSDPANVRLEIVPDQHARYYQWFYFRLCGAKGVPCRLRIENAGGAYVGGWDGYRAVASIDRRTWLRVPTSYADGILTIELEPQSNSVYLAYFAPYSMERHDDLIATCLATGRAEMEIVGKSLDGRNIDLLRVGAPAAESLVVWITARQHPGEVMAQWWAEGFLERLLDVEDETAAKLRESAVFYIVPNMNPDGSRRGHLRTNAAGVDLNRAWSAPDESTMPEVYFVRQRMLAVPPDLHLDVHGTEDMPHVFAVGPQGPTAHSEPIAGLVREFKAAMLAECADFQVEQEFPVPRPEDADLSIASNYLCEAYGWLSITLEMPFKDTTHTPDRKFGWSPQRSKRLGAGTLDVLATMIAPLRQRRSLRERARR